MKTLYIPLEDKEYEKLKKVKGKTTWRDLIMSLTKKEGNK